MAEEFVTEITKKSEDFSEWYVQVVRRAELADYSPLKGCMVIRPYGFTIWENIQDALDRRLKETGHVNAYFPLFIPESFLSREAEHVKGFAPQVAWVTQGGDEILEERWAVRPTSEAIIGYMYSKWVRSWRDLPILINQWCNIVRWEKVTRLFLRTTEFLWQEGHTLHRTHEEALEEVLRILEIYRDLVENDLAIPVITGKKSPSEKFAGALDTFTLEALMPDGKALQCGTSHDLGQNFSRAFEITFLDSDGQEKHAWSTSWGVSTRLIGGLIMVHGDDSGLIIPPRIAPYQVVIVPIFYGQEQEEVINKARELRDLLKKSGIRVLLDDRDEYTPGWKFSEWELRGVPLRLEIGPRDLASSEAVLVRRDNREKRRASWEALPTVAPQVLESVQKSLFDRAKNFRETNTRESEDFSEFKKIMEEKRGFILSPWCGNEACEEEVKAQTTATIRCIKDEEPSGKMCLVCGNEAKFLAYFAKSY
ncbi:MAG: proline--tRNA ligase [Caldiserica bacterium]|jgi:prolyl-tRNA synthetase|nr:proline--tRNA ligase [Caldisericota bacterium]MDH7562148.1 proline--tRNA ligase [Caldisericota bacterium]